MSHGPGTAAKRDFGESWFGDDATVIEREVWECAVAAIGEDWFSAHAIRDDNGRDDRRAYVEFYRRDVADQDELLLTPGALFWWVIEVVRRPRDRRHEGRSAIRFRRPEDVVPADGTWVDSVREAWHRPLPELDGVA